MYIDPELRDRVYQMFSLEVPKLLQEIETELVTLSIDRSAAKVKKLLRAAHSIKGCAMSLGLETIGTLAHQIEDIFRVLDRPELPFDRQLELILFEIYDCLNRLVTAQIHGQILDPSFQIRTQIALTRLDDKIGHFVIVGQHIPDSLLFCTNLTQSIFEVDVAQSLTRLERVLLDPDCDRIVVGEFRAQSEIFTGIATLTDTPRFGKLAHATIAALDRHPDRAREICCFALVDFYAALAVILIGKRETSSPISPGFAFLIAEEPIDRNAQSDEPVAVAARDSFDLEDLGDREVALAPIPSPEQEEIDTSIWGELEIAEALEVTVDRRLADREPIERQIPLQRGLSGVRLPLTGVDEDRFDFLVEDILCDAPAVVVESSLNFDLVDIFDIPQHQQQLAPVVVVESSLNFDLVDIYDIPQHQQQLAPVVVVESSLNFDLVDIFDIPQHQQQLAPLVVVESSLNFDLVDIFDIPQHQQQPSPMVAVESSLNFDLVDIFDIPQHQQQLAPVVAVESSLNFDLVDIFDIPQHQQQPSPEIAVFLPELEDETDRHFDLDIFERTKALNATLNGNNMSGLLADIIRNFDKFAPIAPSTFAFPTKIVKPTRVKKSRKIALNPSPQLSIRVGIDRLERMNNLLGELAIERHGLELYNEQFTDTLEQLRSKCANFQTIGDRLQQIGDTLAISAHYPPPPTKEPPDELAANLDVNEQFDILELDRYSEIHQIAQSTIEQVAQIEEQIEDLVLFVTQSHHQIDRQKQLLSHLRDDLMWARMLPLGEILNRFPRTIHDLSIEFDKPVDLKITGAGVLVDRAVIEKLFDPLVHLLRNAFDHGIDPLATRRSIGKPDRGSIEINAYHQGSQTVIEIADDGGGIDLDKIKAKAIDLQLLTPTDAATATRAQLLDFLFTPGFSTAERVTKLSGRGMGLDIVKEQIQSIKGTIEIDSQVGRGTTFTLRIPLTLTIAQLMVCQVGNALYAFPADSIQKIIVPIREQLTQQDTQRIFRWCDLHIPIYNLADLLTYSIPIPERTISHTLKSSGNNPDDWLPPLLMIRRGDRIFALEIDRMITEQELTIKPFGKAITPPSYSYGCTILGDGVILPVLDPHTLIQVLVERPHTPHVPAAPAMRSSNSILVVDDSITTRQSLCLTLEKFGYRTLQANDGQAALHLLRQKTNEIKLVICDVEMPNMNGFEFLNVYRQDRDLTHIPVVMLTSRSNAKHRQFAAHLGAVDYFIKPYVEQDFMREIGKIVGVEADFNLNL